MKTLSQLQETADKLFSEYIRKKNAKNGKVQCVTCGVWLDIREIQCGHFISRDKFAVRYDEDNAAPQCPVCNSRHNEDTWPYTEYILKTKDSGTLTRLTIDSLRFISSLDKRLILEEKIKDLRIKLSKL